MKKRNKLIIKILMISILLLLVCKCTMKVKAEEYEGIDFSCVFDADYYYNQYGDLQEAFEYDENLLWQHFINCGMNEGRRASEEFDVSAYSRRYGDLKNAYGDDWKQYYIHYAKCGKYEGRTGVTYIPSDFAPVFNAENYMNRNLDVRLYYGNDEGQAFMHFLSNGMAEGRQASNNFDVRAYKQANADLSMLYGDDYTQYYFHYIYYGQYENRVTTDCNTIYCGDGDMEETYQPVFNAAYYLENNPDVKKALGNDETVALYHFIANGMNEGRRGNLYFDLDYYKENNPDLRKAFGEDNIQYYLHYIRCGKAEGRQGAEITEPVYYDLEAGAIGIDVSHWQEEIDWEAVKNDGIQYAIIRVGCGDDLVEQDDKWAVHNMNECERLGIPYGVYLYSYATNETEANSEVEHIKRMLQGRTPRMGVYIDIEATEYYERYGIDVYSASGRRLITDLTKIILNGITAAGYDAGWYANLNYCRNVLYYEELTGYRWIAGYDNPDYEPEVQEKGALMWQYTSSGSVNGISGRVDMNRLMQGIRF